MIYLIGGAPRVGKTTIARQFAKLIKGRIISTDELKKADNQQSSVNFFCEPEKNTLIPAERIEKIQGEAKQIIPDIDYIAYKAIKMRQSVVIEGVHLFPANIHRLIQRFGRDKIKAILIGSTSTELIMDGMVENTSANN